MRLPRIPWRRITSGRALPWALFTVTLGAALFNWSLWRGLHDEKHTSEVVTSVSREFLLALTNFSARTIDADVERIRAFAVGDFAQQVNQTFSDARIAQIKSAKVTSTATVQSVFPESIEGSQATVFGVVNETVTNAGNPAPRADVLRIELTLIETTDGWKINSVDILQSPGAGATG